MKKVKTPITLEDEDLNKVKVYPSNKEVELLSTKLAVQSPYTFVRFKGQLHIVASWVPEAKTSGYNITDVSLDSVVNNYINPFNEEYLLEDVVNIDLKSSKSVLEFCNKYGLLGEKVNNFPAENSGGESFNGKILASLVESYKYFMKQIKEIQSLVLMYRKIVKPLKEAQLKNEEFELTLKQGINQGLGLVRPAINMEYEGDFLPGYTTSTLLGAIYYKLYEVVTEEKQFRECLHCHSLFIPRKANARFCPPPYSGKHSSCQNSYNQMKSRARKAVKSGTKTIEEISNSLGRPFDEVRGWFH